MAEGNPSLFANHVLRLLHSEGIKKINAPQERLDELENKVSTLRDRLLEAEKKNSGDWLMKIEDVLGDADNLLEALSTVDSIGGLKTNTVQRSLISGLFSTTASADSRLNMTREIDEIIKRLEEIPDPRAGNFTPSNLEERSDGFQPIERLETNSFLEESNLVSRDKDQMEITGILLNPEYERNVSVLPIVGMGGTGKTTLAQAVFNDEKVKRHFQKRIWVCVSQDLDIGRISRDIAERVTDKKMGNLEVKTGEKRCLIVFDDVWSEDRLQWESLIRMLKDAVKEVKVIVTTRSKKVASIVGTDPPYFLLGKDLDESWNLFKRVAFDGEEPLQSNQKKIGMEVVRKYKGVPLAIKAIGSMLRCRDSKYWEDFYVDEFSTSSGKSCGDEMLQLLQLSFNSLPLHLRHCFAYCSLFPKPHEFDVQIMVKLWMAQGFIEPQVEEESLEDAGYQCFFELLKRDFFQESERDLTERVTKFRVHDLMHDLASSVAGKQCVTLSSHGNDVNGRTFHVSFASGYVFSEEQIPAFLIKAKKIRSILMPNQLLLEDRSGRADKICKLIISGFRFLRTLDMHALGIKIVPNSIGKLILLKYLDLSENGDITELPSSITNLVNLQTLRLSSCFKLKKLPRGIINLVNLRHLETDGCYSLVSLPPEIRQLRNLQTLPQLVVSEGNSSRSNELKGLDVPNKLGDLKKLRHGDNMASYLDKIQEVQTLSLEWESSASILVNDEPINCKFLVRLRELTLIGFRGDNLFSPSFPSNLVRLCLSRWEKGNNLAPLKQCSNLKELVLHKIEHLEYILNDVESTPMPFFQYLEDLCLIELPKLKGWWKETVNSENLPSFPHLSKLVIEDCPKLAVMPLFPTLDEELVLDSTCLQPLLNTMEHGAKHAASSSTSEQPSPLSELKNLQIVNMNEFNNSEADKIQWNTLQCLQKLKFDFLPELTTLPVRLQDVKSLEELDVWRCGVMELPPWIGKLKALKKLVIRVCPKLGGLPQEFCELKELTLEIEGCPKLIRRCEKEIGADWDKIEHLERYLRLGQISGA